MMNKPMITLLYILQILLIALTGAAIYGIFTVSPIYILWTVAAIFLVCANRQMIKDMKEAKL